MSDYFDKDVWIKLMLRNRHIACDKKGNIYRVHKNKDGSERLKLLKPQTHKPTGRVYLNLTYMGFTKSALVNRIIGLAYLPNPEHKAEVNHIDGNKANNALDNLEWADRSEQEKHAFATGLKSTRGSQNSNAKLTADQVLEIRRRAALGHDVGNLALLFAISPSTVRGIIDRKTWKHI